MNENNSGTLFYSWASGDHKNKLCNVIEKICKNLNIKFEHSTLGNTGSPEIVSTILEKIKTCDYYICDCTAIGYRNKQGKLEEFLDTKALNLSEHEKNEIKERVPNSNVMFELGYASAFIPHDRILILITDNTDNRMPFNINHRRRSYVDLEKLPNEIVKQLTPWITQMLPSILIEFENKLMDILRKNNFFWGNAIYLI